MPPIAPAATAAVGVIPNTVALPLSGASSPSSMSMVVDLPAPFGPSSATVSPGAIDTSIDRTARTGPFGVRKVFVRPASSMPCALRTAPPAAWATSVVMAGNSSAGARRPWQGGQPALRADIRQCAAPIGSSGEHWRYRTTAPATPTRNCPSRCGCGGRSTTASPPIPTGRRSPSTWRARTRWPQVRAAYPDLAAGTETDDRVGVTGRVIFVRNTGKLCFATLREGAVELQVMLSRDEVGEQALADWKADVDLGDQVFVTGRGHLLAPR